MTTIDDSNNLCVEFVPVDDPEMTIVMVLNAPGRGYIRDVQGNCLGWFGPGERSEDFVEALRAAKAEYAP